MSTPAVGPLAVHLAEVRERVTLVLDPRVEPIPVPGDDAGNARLRLAFEDAPALLAALEAVLRLADEWLASDLGALDRAEIRKACAEDIRGVISSALRDAQGGVSQ